MPIDTTLVMKETYSSPTGRRKVAGRPRKRLVD